MGSGRLLHVQAALALRGFFPPPARRSLVLTRPDWPRAGLATDRYEAMIVQLVVGHALRADVIPHLRRRPERQRVQLHQRRPVFPLEARVELDHRHLAARRRALIAALPRGPRRKLSERPSQGLYLADAATFAVPVLAEAEQTLLAHQVLDRERLGEHDL